MKNALAIAGKEFRTYFGSPIAYIISGMFLFLMGWMFFNNLYHYAQSNLAHMQGMSRGVSMTDGLIRPLFGNMNVVLLFLVPLITMRLFAEEKKTQTIQLLLTAPLKLSEIIFGKFLGAFSLVAVMLALTLVYPLVLGMAGKPDWGPLLTCYLGTLLQAGCYVALGVFFSSLTENQVVAGVLTIVTLLLLWLISWAAQGVGPFWSDIVMYLSMINHFNNFSQGLLSSTGVVYYLSFMGISLYLTHRVLDSYRWR